MRRDMAGKRRASQLRRAEGALEASREDRSLSQLVKPSKAP